jgi:uncharacterized protein (DUF302 family)
MKYYFSKTIPGPFEEAITKVEDALKSEGFGILTHIDVKATLKHKLNFDFRKYNILGACNPRMAFRALEAEPHIGTMLPCNVVVQETEKGQVEVSAVDPVASMQAIENPHLAEIAAQVRYKLQAVIASL